ncbi:hypothetical protein B0T25DRAFT_565267 [Lasiosphaeria hispida]|uniref:C2H2-type domain-containing protein n=1 Tax=Lasiosphaeria hispida TaxID=260671 RepID=A0AAJ0MIT4_9PEZI|nr:hypothetical protein B0T25DRAFT_565267 [Lasiosphaeria hispida]
MSSAQKAQQTHPLFLEQCRTKYSWASGATRGTPSAIERHRKDLKVAFSEINGLMAGMHYQDQAEGNHPASPSLRSPPPLQATREHLDCYPTEIDITDDLLGNTPGSHHTAPPEPAATIEDQPMASQWAAIRSLRKETEFHHERFQVHVRRLQDPIISNLLDIYPDARSIRNTGAQLVKDILEGFQPHKLSLVFAFTCFSYSISQLLYKKGHIAKSDTLANIRVWRDLIADPRERQAFNHLAPKLWPEAKEHLHFIDIPAFPVDSAQATPAPLSDLWLATSSSLVGPAGLSPSQLLHSQPSGQISRPADNTASPHLPDQYPFGVMPPDPSLRDPAPVIENLVGLLNSSHGAIDFSTLGVFSSQLQWQPDEPDPPAPPLGPPVPPTKFDPSDRERKRSQLANQAAGGTKLEETVMFLVVLAFLQEIGQLLYTLSGSSLASRCHKMYPAQQGEQEAFYRKARDTFFEPWSQRPSSGLPAFRALVSVADMFTRDGYLQSIDEIEHYLAGVAVAVLPPGAAFKEFLYSILGGVYATPTRTPDSSSPRKRQRNTDEDPVTASKRDRTKPGPPPVSCEECDYTCPRRDRVRSHFLKQHPGIALPERLREKGRSSQGL